MPRPGLVGGAGEEGFAGCRANVGVVGAGGPQDCGGGGGQGGADSLSVPGRCHADASDGPGGGAKDGREYGIGAGAAQQQGPDDVPGIIARDQHVLRAGLGEPAGPAGEGGPLEGQHVGRAAADPLGYGDTPVSGALVGAWGRAVPSRVCYQVEGAWLCCQPREVKNRTAPGRSRGTPGQM